MRRHGEDGPAPRQGALAITLALLVLAPAAAAAAAQTGPPAASRKVVIPFDFDSTFDDGAYGRTIGELFWKKIRREGGFILPESMQDVRDSCQRANFHPGPDTPLDRLKDFVVKDQAGDIGIWGKVERIAGHDEDVYDLWIGVADFSTDPPRMIHQAQARTKTVSEIPHVHVQRALDDLYGRSPAVAETRASDPAREARWASGPNLVKGDFEQGRGGPAGWDPPPRGVIWVLQKGKGETSVNRLIRFTLNEEVAGSTGVLYYSADFPVEEGATYRFQCRWKSTGSSAKVFIKCYDELPTGFRNAAKQGPPGVERREVYRSQQNLEGPAGEWNVQTEEFTPTHPRYTPRWGRVMLYAYWPAGTVEWDDVVVKQVAPPPGTGPRRSPSERRR